MCVFVCIIAEQQITTDAKCTIDLDLICAPIAVFLEPEVKVKVTVFKSKQQFWLAVTSFDPANCKAYLAIVSRTCTEFPMALTLV